MTIATQVTTELEFHTCAECGVPFGIPTRVGSDRREKGGHFYCPNGHILTYAETELKKLRRQVVEEREKFFAEQRAHEATQKEMKRLRKRSVAGVCPCCHRTFSNMTRHMNTKHQDFVKEAKQ